MDIQVQIQQYLFVIDGYFHVKAKIIHKFEENKQNTTVEWDKQGNICHNHQIIITQSLNKSIQIKYTLCYAILKLFYNQKYNKKRYKENDNYIIMFMDLLHQKCKENV